MRGHPETSTEDEDEREDAKLRFPFRAQREWPGPILPSTREFSAMVGKPNNAQGSAPPEKSTPRIGKPYMQPQPNPYVIPDIRRYTCNEFRHFPSFCPQRDPGRLRVNAPKQCAECGQGLQNGRDPRNEATRKSNQPHHGSNRPIAQKPGPATRAQRESSRDTSIVSMQQKNRKDYGDP